MDPAAEEAHKYGHVIPFTATEIITSEIKSVLSHFFYRETSEPDNDDDITKTESEGEDQTQNLEPDSSLFALLLTIVRPVDPNPVLLGYLEKIFQILVNTYPREVHA